MWIKLLGGGMLLLAASALGQQLCRREHERLERLDGYCALMRYIASHIEIYGLEFGEIIRRCDQDILRKCGFDAPPASAERLCAEAGAWLDDTSLHALETVAAALEQGTRRALGRALDDCNAALETAQSGERARVRERCRVIRVLCLCGGALLTLLLL